jgi:hypothetical protein
LILQKQLKTESCHETSYNREQDPWKDCSAEFRAHFEELENTSRYTTNVYPIELDLYDISNSVNIRASLSLLPAI